MVFSVDELRVDGRLPAALWVGGALKLSLVLLSSCRSSNPISSSTRERG